MALGHCGSAIAQSLPSTELRSLPGIVRGLRAAPNTRGFRRRSADAQGTYVRMMSYYDVHGLSGGNLDDLPKMMPRRVIGYQQVARRTATERRAAAF